MSRSSASGRISCASWCSAALHRSAHAWRADHPCVNGGRSGYVPLGRRQGGMYMAAFEPSTHATSPQELDEMKDQRQINARGTVVRDKLAEALAEETAWR